MGLLSYNSDGIVDYFDLLGGYYGVSFRIKYDFNAGMGLFQVDGSLFARDRGALVRDLVDFLACGRFHNDQSIAGCGDGRLFIHGDVRGYLGDLSVLDDDLLSALDCTMVIQINLSGHKCASGDVEALGLLDHLVVLDFDLAHLSRVALFGNYQGMLNVIDRVLAGQGFQFSVDDDNLLDLGGGGVEGDNFDNMGSVFKVLVS